MKIAHHFRFFFFFLLLLAGFSAGCNGAGNQAVASTPTPSGPPIPTLYTSLNNPKTGDAAAIAQGKELFSSNCIGCHGTTGKGDGPHASELNPRPAPLAELESTRSDGYLFWRISEGGLQPPFNSSMPSWKSTFDTDQIWSLVTFIRSLPK